jgi:hypothetical protein
VVIHHSAVLQELSDFSEKKVAKLELKNKNIPFN